jgi:hypothetical protein
MDIANPIYRGLKLEDQRSALSWPKQQHPGKAAWKLWKTNIKCLADDTIYRHPLGKYGVVTSRYSSAPTKTPEIQTSTPIIRQRA